MNSSRSNIVIALMLAMFLGAVEGTVVTTAIPTIVKELQGFELISLVFSAYLLTSAIFTPIYGKLSDLYGRKNILSIGIIIFLVGSLLCGLSQTMYMLIGFRAIQGAGAGAIFTVTFTIIGDIYTLQERTRIQGFISTVWGIASLVGPFLGGILVEMLSWHWIFYINIPFGIMSIILLQRNLKEKFTKTKHNIDFFGAITLSAAILIFMNIFISGDNWGTNYNLFIGISILLTMVLLIAFCKIERKAKEPFIPFDIFTKTSTIVNTISFLASAILIGSNVYFPIYLQNVLGFSAKISGLALAPMSMAWLSAAVLSGKCIMKYGAKLTILISNLILLISTVLLPTLGVDSSLLIVVIYVVIMGFGFGGAFTTITIIVQEAVEFNKRGVATSTNSLLRIVGQTIGVSVFGSMFNSYITKYFIEQGVTGVAPSNLYKSFDNVVAITGEQIKLSLNYSLHALFTILIVIAAGSLILSIILPKLSRE